MKIRDERYGELYTVPLWMLPRIIFLSIVWVAVLISSMIYYSLRLSIDFIVRIFELILGLGFTLTRIQKINSTELRKRIKSSYLSMVVDQVRYK